MARSLLRGTGCFSDELEPKAREAMRQSTFLLGDWNLVVQAYAGLAARGVNTPKSRCKVIVKTLWHSRAVPRVASASNQNGGGPPGLPGPPCWNPNPNPCIPGP